MVAAREDEGAMRRIQELERRGAIMESGAMRIYQRGMEIQEEYKDEVHHLQGLLMNTETRLQQTQHDSEYASSVANRLYSDGQKMQANFENSIMEYRNHSEIAVEAIKNAETEVIAKLRMESSMNTSITPNDVRIVTLENEIQAAHLEMSTLRAWNRQLDDAYSEEVNAAARNAPASSQQRAVEDRPTGSNLPTGDGSLRSIRPGGGPPGDDPPDDGPPGLPSNLPTGDGSLRSIRPGGGPPGDDPPDDGPPGLPIGFF
eukprot:s5925_g1.t1